jgi:membrane-bound lytic murein transglycosylase MltF
MPYAARLSTVFFIASLLLVVPLLHDPGSAVRANPGLEAFKGDFDGMLERRALRALVVYNKMMYFLDGATQRGIVYEGLENFAKLINEKYELGARKLDVVFIPVPRDQLLPMLVDGYGDLAVANLTITGERSKIVDFTEPTYPGVRELLVTGPGAPEIGSLDELAGQAIHVRTSSSYFESLTGVNRDFESRDLQPIELIPASEYLEDGDLLELVHVGLIPMVIVDSHKAAFWKDVYDNIVVREDIAVREGADIAWAMRKNSPKLMAISNEYIKSAKKGTLLGNILLKRYVKDNQWVKNPTTTEEMKKFHATLEYFTRYAEKYDFDWLMLTALGYQESRLDHSVRSAAGAVGVMQILPSTAKDPNVGIPDVDNIESNVHAGAKYLKFLRDRYFDDDNIDDVNQTLFAFASYNAGPAKVARLRKEAAEAGFDPNVWFGNVEVICAKRIGRETTQYVSNIYKYHIAYKLVLDKANRKTEALEGLKS